MNQIIVQILNWRPLLSKAAAVLIGGILLYWGLQNYQVIADLFAQLGLLRLLGILLLLNLAVFLSALTFTLLIRGIGYPFSYVDSYHSINLSQLASMMPGKVWGFVGLASLLWSKGLSKSDAVVVISFNTLLMLAAATFVGIGGFVAAVGPVATLFVLLLFVLFFIARPWLEHWRIHISPNSSSLPSFKHMLIVFILGVANWILVSTSFALVVFYTLDQTWPISPWLVGSAFAAGYVAGFISLVAPSGLGVREGIIAVILGASMGLDKAFAAAVLFRIVHMLVLCFNILMTMLLLNLKHSEIR